MTFCAGFWMNAARLDTSVTLIRAENLMKGKFSRLVFHGLLNQLKC